MLYMYIIMLSFKKKKYLIF